MCGIAGMVSTDTLPDGATAIASRMRDSMPYRGPDESGLHADEHAVLAHRRLSIVDLSSGQQPMSNETGDVWVTFNGEIYNHAQVRNALEAEGHVYRTTSDTETIVHAYEQWGAACVHRFRGMFAFAIWDQRARRLLLVRDRLGVKPLYWTRAGHLLLFASEIKAILASGLVEARANEAALPELLSTRYLSGTETMFRGIHKLLPGHLLTLENGDVRISGYWDVPVGDEPVKGTAADIVHEFRARLEESVRARLMSDVPLGMFLSGGIDSSAIAAIMARQIDRPLQTFSVAFEDRACNELEYSRDVARAIGADAHEVVVGDRDFFTALPRLVWHEDEPIAHPSSVPLYFVSALARKHVTVVLTGEGSDELLAGYGKYQRIAWNWYAGTVYERMLPRPVRQFIADTVVPKAPAAARRYLGRSFLSMERTPEAMFYDNFAAIRLREQRTLLARSRRSAVTERAAYATSSGFFNHAGGSATFLSRLLYADIKTYLVELLMKQDQMSMAASIESRVPFLDQELVEFAARLPDEWKLSGLTTKRVLREAMKGVLPRSILERPKLGFPVPFSHWLRGGWNDVARDVLLDRRSCERGVIDPAAVSSLLADHAAGRTNAGDRIWSLLNLELWYRTFIDGGGVQHLPAASPVPHANPLAESRPAAAAR
ncbi:MAG TPA: asparagine synthase (glutamine-hydrolyzing) [Vicinamibacterales bacterium]|nr:asparagine synthase (glutamine-hydrolyzing) [Vicinamibacterales bacterium]